MSQPEMKYKKPYVTKEEKERFLQWYLSNYGFNTHLKENNSRVLSEAYHRETGVLIPKITIYRWLGKLDPDKVKNFSTEYIDLSLLNGSLTPSPEEHSDSPPSDNVKEGLQ